MDGTPAPNNSVNAVGRADLRDEAPRTLLPRAPGRDAWASPAKPDGSGRPASWARTALSLAGVVTLIILLAWGYRAVTSSAAGGRWPLRKRNATLIEVVSRTTLSPRQSLCLVRIGPRLVLLGVTAGAVRSLDVIHDPDLTATLLGQATAQQPDSSTAEFTRCLEREARPYQASETDLDETVTPEEDRLLNVKELLAGTIRRLQATAIGA
jgi:flagellar biogenesis protein FliO